MLSLLLKLIILSVSELNGVKISDKVERAGRGVELSCVDADMGGYQV